MNTFKEILTSEKLQYVLLAFGLYWAWAAASVVVTIAVIWHIISSLIKLNIQIFKLDRIFFSGSATITRWVRGIVKGSVVSRSTSVSLAGEATTILLKDAGVQPRKKKGVSRRGKTNDQVSSPTNMVKDDNASV